MQRLRVQRERAEQHIIHLCHRPAERVIEGLAFVEVLEVEARHGDGSCAKLGTSVPVSHAETIPGPDQTRRASNGGTKSAASNSTTQMSGSNRTWRPI